MSEPKRKLPRATLEQKIQILDYYHKLERPQLDTVDKFKDEVAISTLTFNEWVKHEAEYRLRYQALDTDFQKNARRKVKYKYGRINRAMDLLVQQRMERGEAITEPILRGYWQIYAHQFGVDNPKRLCGFSHGWLSQFKKRHGLAKRKDDEYEEGDKYAKFEKDKYEKAEKDKFEMGKFDKFGAEKYNEKVLGRAPTPPGDKSGATFQPQQTLSFPPQFPYYKEDPTEKTVGARDIERFLFTVADLFFHEHQYDYPQTVKLYQEFKLSFLSERLIDLRLLSEQTIQLKPREKRHQSQSVQPMEERIGREDAQMGQMQIITQDLQLQIGNDNMADLRSQPQHRHRSRLRRQPSQGLQESIQERALQERALQERALQERALQKRNLQERSLQDRSLQEHSLQEHSLQEHNLQERNLQERSLQERGLQERSLQERGLQAAHEQAREARHDSPNTQGVYPNMATPNVAQMPRQEDKPRGAPLPLPQLMPFHRLRPLSREQGSPVLGQREQPEQGLDEMFRQKRGYDAEWSKSALRKIWEQNKLMLS